MFYRPNLSPRIPDWEAAGHLWQSDPDSVFKNVERQIPNSNPWSGRAEVWFAFEAATAEAAQ